MCKFSNALETSFDAKEISILEIISKYLNIIRSFETYHEGIKRSQTQMV